MPKLRDFPFMDFPEHFTLNYHCEDLPTDYIYFIRPLTQSGEHRAALDWTTVVAARVRVVLALDTFNSAGVTSSILEMTCSRWHRPQLWSGDARRRSGPCPLPCQGT